MMQKPFCFLMPIAALYLNASTSFSSPLTTTKTNSKTSAKSTPAKPASVTKSGFSIKNVSRGGDVIRTNFVPGSVTSNYSPFDRKSNIQFIQITGKTLFGPTGRSVQISENNRRSLFENSVGKSLAVGSGGSAGGVPTVLVEYRQDNPPGRWRAKSGTVIIDAYRRNSPLTEIVTFRLINARFTPIFGGKGDFTLSLNGTTSGARNPN